MKIPENYQQLMPYLIVKDAYKFMDFMKDIFGATQQYLMERSPGVIMHAELRIGEAVIMFCDATDTYAISPAGMFLYIENVDAIFEKATAMGLTIITPLENREYGRGGGFQDNFGNTWWANTPV